MRLLKFLLINVLLAFLGVFSLQAQAQTGSISGFVKDKSDKSELIGVNVIIKGTMLGTATDLDGKYTIKDVKPGQYTIECTYIGYGTVLLTDIKVKAGETTKLDIEMATTSVTIDQEVVIVGRKPLVDIEQAKTINTIKSENIELAPARQVQQIINTQPGVVNTPSGLHIRGSRTYETGFYIDGVSARDPLAGTGFGVDIGSNGIDEISVTTGGVGAEYGDATGGIVSTKTKSGGDKREFGFLYKRDDFGFNSDWSSVFNHQVGELNVGGPVRLKKDAGKSKLKYYTTLRFSLTDEYYQNPADQVVSSLYPNTAISPFQDNRWSALLKLNYDFNPRQKLFFTYLRSLTVNQDVNMLRITGNDLPFFPGYQFLFTEQMDNANTYTHDSYLTVLNWRHTMSNRFSYRASLSRLFVHLRADANGRDWRPDNVDSEFDPYSIVTFPATVFNPGDSIAFVNPVSGFYNNGGIATLWHDHYVEEYVLNTSGTLYSKNTFNKLSFGLQMKFQDLQWIDIERPWIGAPVTLPDGSVSQSFRLGDLSDVWRVQPKRGAVFVSDKIKYKGLIAEVGARFEYWAPGKFVDDAIDDPRSPIRDEIREDYKKESIKILGLRHKLRLLPRISASFPVKENQMLYFNYGHTSILPHPSFVYAGLDPFFTDRSTLSRLGNPNLNPEVDISYEIGLRSQITSNDALTIAAFTKDKYDFITSASLLVEDINGREVSRTVRINSDYARIRGIEASYIKRIGKWFNGQLSATYMAATGQSSSASENLKEILASGSREDTKEFFLPWDTPFDIKLNTTFRINNKTGLFNIKALNRISFYFETVYRAGRRYTPYIQEGVDPVSGRPNWVPNTDPDKRFSEVGQNWFWVDFNLRKWWKVKSTYIAWTVEITNMLNNSNSAIINPVTGRAYQAGDDVPDDWRDPRFADPRDPRSNNQSPFNPSRFLQQRHFLTGIVVKLN